MARRELDIIEALLNSDRIRPRRHAPPRMAAMGQTRNVRKGFAMRYASLFVCVLALYGCKSAEQIAAEKAEVRARLAANTKEFCISIGYPAGSIEQARCAEEMAKKAMDNDSAAAQAGAVVAAAQARNRVSCTGYGNTVNCY